MDEPDRPGEEIPGSLFEQSSRALPVLEGMPKDGAELACLVEPWTHAEALASAFQPVFRASTGELEGCEALARVPSESGFRGPYELFRAARRTDLLLQLQSAAILRHLEDARRFIGGLRLFLNVAAPLFSNPRFGSGWLREQILASGLNPGQVILELPEFVGVRDLPRFSDCLEPFRREGFRLAIDDFGAGYTNLRMIVDLSPDFVKVDRVFVEGVASHARKRILVESVVALCHRVGCAVVAEGVETSEDLETCLTAGVDLLQGFLFARPCQAAEAFSAASLALPVASSGREGDDLRGLVVTLVPVDADEPLETACARFLREPGSTVLPVVRGGAPVRLLRRESAAAVLRLARAGGGPLPRAGDPLPGVDGAFERVAELGSPEEAAAAVLGRPPERRFEPLVAVGPDLGYRGIVPVDALLAELSRLKVEYSLQPHPVTQLPGRVLFEHAVSRRLARRTPFALGRASVCGFSSYNDRYGFLRGDDLLVAAASHLRATAHEDTGGFAAHLTGDDFAWISAPDRAREEVASLILSFDEAARRLHDPADVKAGGFFVRDRGGVMAKMPLASLAAGVALWDAGAPASVRSVLAVAEALLSSARDSPPRIRVGPVEPAEYDASEASTPGLEIATETPGPLPRVARTPGQPA